MQASKNRLDSNNNKAPGPSKEVNPIPTPAILTEGRNLSKSTTKKSAPVKAPSLSVTGVTGNLNHEDLLVLQDLNSNINKQGAKLKSLAKRVDDLYSAEYQYEDNCEQGEKENSLPLLEE